METKIELEVITNQLQSSLDELKRKRIDRNLIHDYITEALSRVKKLNEPAVGNNEVAVEPEKHKCINCGKEYEDIDDAIMCCYVSETDC